MVSGSSVTQIAAIKNAKLISDFSAPPSDNEACHLNCMGNAPLSGAQIIDISVELL